MIEVVIGDVVVRAGADIDEAVTAVKACEKLMTCMGAMIEQIWSRKARTRERATSSLFRFGPVPQTTIPASGFRK
ncbi:hypothetical protein [Rhizobium sp. LjRoot258]|uniref:hypothetical protein n=1 Tax=Rhizobium sp. LjRoot258 TaxID=3342299 RepID=UPI003ECE6237